MALDKQALQLELMRIEFCFFLVGLVQLHSVTVREEQCQGMPWQPVAWGTWMSGKHKNCRTPPGHLRRPMSSRRGIRLGQVIRQFSLALWP